MDFSLIAIFLAAGYLLMILAEYRLDRTNYPFLKHAGGQEVSRVYVKTYYITQRLIAVIAIFGFYIQLWRPYSKLQLVMGLSLIFCGVVIKVWAFESLGRLWSYRCIYIPEMPKVKTGIYRWMDHPEYNGRFLEVSGILVITGSWTLFLFLVWNAIHAWKIALIEEKQMKNLGLEKPLNMKRVIAPSACNIEKLEVVE